MSYRPSHTKGLWKICKPFKYGFTFSKLTIAKNDNFFTFLDFFTWVYPVFFSWGMCPKSFFGRKLPKLYLMCCTLTSKLNKKNPKNSKLQFNILDDSLKLGTGLGSSGKCNKFMANMGMGFYRACTDCEFMGQPCWLPSWLQHGHCFNVHSSGPGWFIFLLTWLTKHLQEVIP